MASFWDESNRDHCSGPPGVPPGEGEFVPNCWAGMMSRLSLNVARYPYLALGLNDYSMEFWFRADNVGDSETDTDSVDIGFWEDPPNVAGGADGTGVFYVYPDNDASRVFFGSAPVTVNGVSTPSVPDWRLHAVNFDRDGNMTYYIDAELVDTDDISGAAANNLGSPPFICLVGADTDVHSGWDDWHDDDPTAWGWGHSNGVMGPVAVHVTSFLTVAQMQESIERRYVNNLATTQLLYDWRTPTGVLGWDGDQTHIIRGITDYKGLPLAAPEGADGTVVVTDLSGNGNDLTLTTRSVYNTTIPGGADWNDWTILGRSCCAFASDPFFRHGGLI